MLTRKSKKIILTIDLEWFYSGYKQNPGYNFDTLNVRERIASDGGCIQRSLQKIIQIAEKYNQRMTFFTVAELDAVCSREIAYLYNSGHEIGLHTYRHAALHTAEAFENDLRKSSAFQRKYHIISYRAPAIHIQKDFYRLLHRYRYLYDSSVYGTRRFRCQTIRVIPVSVLPYGQDMKQTIPSCLNPSLVMRSLPFGSGLFVGALKTFYPAVLDRYYRKYTEPACVFIHSWQIDNPGYSMPYLFRHPMMLPYSVDCTDIFEYICRNYTIITVKEHAKEISYVH